MIRFLSIFFLCSFGIAQTDSVPDRLNWDKAKKNSKELISLLSYPLDLQTFKKLKPERSNSGAAKSHSYFYKPAQKGFYYGYFVFGGFVGGPCLVTYQKGTEIGAWIDTAEVFIQMSCDKPDKDLGKLDLVGLQRNDIVKKFGTNYLKSGDTTLVYQHNNTLLVINGSEKVKWFKLTRLSRSFKNFEELKAAPELLQYFKFPWQ